VIVTTTATKRNSSTDRIAARIAASAERER
jgi:hypothetical protein